MGTSAATGARYLNRNTHTNVAECATQPHATPSFRVAKRLGHALFAQRCDSVVGGLREGDEVVGQSKLLHASSVLQAQ
jgi:hypothetical protein